MVSLVDTRKLHIPAPVTPQVRRFPPLPIADAGKVRLGGQGPVFRVAAIADSGKVRLGGQGPVFR
jgi:hypothetical protein